MSKYFDGCASFDYKEMSKEKLMSELKEKVRYIGELKRSHNDEIAKIQSAKDKQIADLEAKLAESESRFQSHKQNDARIIQDQGDLIEQLKQQLAEKNADLHQIYSHLGVEAFCEDIHEQALNEIGRLQQQLAEWQDGTIICKWTDAENKVKELEQQLSEKEELIMFADRTIKGLVLAKEIDKISFCIEKLEKVKWIVEDIQCTCGDDNNIDRDFLIKEIDKQLKEMKQYGKDKS